MEDDQPVDPAPATKPARKRVTFAAEMEQVHVIPSKKQKKGAATLLPPTGERDGWVSGREKAPHGAPHGAVSSASCTHFRTHLWLGADATDEAEDEHAYEHGAQGSKGGRGKGRLVARV